MQRLIKYYGKTANGYKAVPGTPQQSVDVFLQGPGLRYTMDAPFAGQAIPQKGAKGLRSVIRKERVRPPAGIPEYRLRFNLKREVVLDKDEASNFTDPLVSGATRGPEYARTYRQKKRWSFVPIDSVVKDFRIDITAVRQVVQSGRGEGPATYADIMKAHETYEAEVEYTGKDVLVGANAISVAKAMLGHCIVLLKVIDDTDHLLSTSEHREVLAQYAALAGTNKFIGPKPVTMELMHLACDGQKDLGGTTPCVTRDYTITDKTDGTRRILFVADDKRLFTISDTMVVRDTGRVMRTLTNTILDGEHLPDRFLVFDTMFYKGTDVRDLPLKILTSSASDEGAVKKARKRSHGGASTTLTDRLTAARSAVADIAPDTDEAYSITVKEFMEARSVRSMAEACRHILLKKTTGKLKYEIDGLIFTPATLPMPRSGVRWPETLKWKPPEQNSIDFQVRLHPSSELVVVDGKPHRAADLLVGQDPWLSVKLTALEMISGNAEERLRRGGSYAAVPFSPKEVPYDDPPIHVCYLPMNASGRMHCRNGEEIVDGTVVEFSFDAKTKTSVKWIPMNLRWDKIERQRTSGGVTANNAEAAENVWRTILHPITEETLTSPEAVSAAIKKMKTEQGAGKFSADSYYVAQLKTDDGESGGLRKFHNYWVKKESLLMKFTASKGLGRSIFDFGCGRAGDLNKWIDMGATRVCGIDKYSNNIYDPAWNASPSANVRLLKARGLTLGRFEGRKGDPEEIRHARSMRIVFLPMDASMPIHSQAYIDGLDEASGDRKVARCLWGLDPIASINPPPLKEYHGFAKNAFDLATCMFAIHYFFDRPESLSTFCGNVAAVLRAGGHFVGCCLDGEAVDALMDKEAPKVGDAVEAIGKNGDVIWSIERQYAKGVQKNKSNLFGRRIDVFVNSIGQTFPEYLVDYGDLVEAMEEHGLRPADESEASTLGLCGGKSTGMFEDLFDEMQDAHRGGRQSHPSVVAALAMSAEEKKYSFLHRWFVFVHS